MKVMVNQSPVISSCERISRCQTQPSQGHTVPAGGFAPAVSKARVRICLRGKRPDAGNALIEFTLVMTILLLVSTGLVSFGFALHNHLILTNAVNTGAQQLALSRGQTSDPCATASTAITSAAPTLSSNLTLSFVINGTSYSSTTSCPSGASNMVQGASAQVTATYPCVLAVFQEKYASCSLQSQVTEVIQ